MEAYGVQIIAVISWLFLLTLIQLAIYPFFKQLLPKIAVPVSGTISFLLFGLFSWYAAFFGFPVQIAILPFLFILLWNMQPKKRNWYIGLYSDRTWYLLFYGAFLLFLLIRAFSPDINNAEKFMDHAFITSIITNPTIPPHDPWFAGGNLSVYYYVGYWILAALGITTGTSSSIVFILALPTIFAYAALNCYGLGRLLLKDLHILPLITLIIVNPAFIMLWIQGTHPSMLFWDSTRIISNTINEYPLFSFTFGDVHPHVIGICNQTLLILLLCTAITCWWKISQKSRILLLICTAISLGSMPGINSWDVLLYAPAVMLTGCWIVLTQKKSSELSVTGVKTRIFTTFTGKRLLSGPLVWYICIIPAIAIFLYLPYYLMMETSGLDGIGLVSNPSDPIEFLLVFGFFFAILFLSLLSEITKRPYFLLILIPSAYYGYLSAGLVIVLLIFLVIRHRSSPDFLAIIGLFAVLFCEFFYLKDHMGENWYRLNTVFKFYLPAWLLIGSASLVMAGEMIERSSLWNIHRSSITRLIFIIVLILFIAPLLPACENQAPHIPTLDGAAFLDSWHPDDAAGIAFLKTFPADTVIVEAEDGDYSYFGRISTFTGLSTIIGWPFHEIMWRKDDNGWYAKRLADVLSIYEEPDTAASIMRDYHATILYIGKEEQDRYNVLHPTDEFDCVYTKGDVQIYQLLPDNTS